MNFVIIHNPMAGSENLALINSIKTALTDNGHTVNVEETKYKKHSIKIARQYKDTNSVVIACGGDGTIHEVANGLAKGKAAMLPLPLGSGNDFCRKLYKKPDARIVAKDFGLLSGKPIFDIKPCDLISVNDFWCINVMSVGFDVLVETVGRKLISKFPFIKKFGYKLAILPCLFMNKHFKIDLTANTKSKKPNEADKINTDDFILFAICNSSYYGGGFLPAPDASLNDGILDACIADGISIPKILTLVPKYLKGTADTSSKVHTYTLTEGIISPKGTETFTLNCDGENYEVSKVEFEVVKDALNLCYLPTAQAQEQKVLEEVV